MGQKTVICIAYTYTNRSVFNRYHRFLSASKRLIRSSILGALGTPSEMLEDAGGLDTEGFRGGSVFGGSLIVG